MQKELEMVYRNAPTRAVLTISTTRKMGRRGFVLLAGAQTLTQPHTNPFSGVLGVMPKMKYFIFSIILIVFSIGCARDADTPWCGGKTNCSGIVNLAT
jgi:hypothetical protein